jgi:signal transduction histidine kinase
MKTPETPVNEEGRIAALKRYNILDTLSEKEYDQITKIASEICDTPIALVSFIDADRQWFKSNHGLPARETPRDIAFCAHAINTPEELFIVNDSNKDIRFVDNPLATDNPNVIFYAGAPLNTKDGYSLGTLCVIDNKPRVLTEAQKDSLRALSKQVMTNLELRIANKELLKANEEVLRLNEQLNHFGYRLSHDLKTPLRGIKSVTDLLKEEYENSFDKQANLWLALISSRAVYMDSLIDGMLDFTKATNTKIIYQKFNFKNLIESIKLSCEAIEKCNIKYINCDYFIDHSKIAFTQILQNLITNSIKFKEKGACEIKIELILNKEEYEIIYKDNGPGILEKYHKKVFELFETLDVTQNTGIGLATVNSIVNRLGGKIILEKNTTTSGVSFQIRIPFKDN